MGMMISTGLANYMLATGSLKAGMSGMVMRIYGGAAPASADAALGSATLLCEISEDGTGEPLELAAAAALNTISKDPDQVWKGDNVADGSATFCRFVLESDAGDASATARRIQGDAGLAGRFLNLSNISLVEDAPQSIKNCVFSLPLS